MSDSDLDFIRSLKRALRLVAGALMLQVVGVIGVSINDHFRLNTVVDDMTIVKPRVEQLWWKSQASGRLAETKLKQELQ